MKNLLFLLLVLGLISCGKDGDVGPQGEKGDRGDAGPQGIPGEDGSTILSGTSSPNNSVGKVGDFFLNLANGDLFGPKADSGWGDPFNMKGVKGDTGEGGVDGENGANGQDGKDGSTILSGNEPPSISEGKEGDFYIDTSDYTIYGPKSLSRGWGDPVSLRSNEKNGVISYTIIPRFDKVISSDEDYNFELETKRYYIPDVGTKYISLSYQYDPRHSENPRPNLSFYWEPLQPTTILPEYIRMGLESGISNGVLDVSFGGIDNNGGSNIQFNLKAEIYGLTEGAPLMIPNFRIRVLLSDFNEGGLISKYGGNPGRFFRISH